MTWPDGLRDVYEASYRDLVRVAFLLLGSRAESEEVVQDAVLAMRERWADVRNPGGYLRRSVVHRCYGVLRRRAVAERHQVEPAPAQAPDELVELRDVLLTLPERQRAAVVLRFLADLPDHEIADALGCRPATVRSLVARGLAAIRKELTR